MDRKKNIRLLSWNIKNSIEGNTLKNVTKENIQEVTNDKRKLEEIKRWINDTNPDIIHIQECNFDINNTYQKIDFIGGKDPSQLKQKCRICGNVTKLTPSSPHYCTICNAKLPIDQNKNRRIATYYKKEVFSHRGKGSATVRVGLNDDFKGDFKANFNKNAGRFILGLRLQHKITKKWYIFINIWAPHNRRRFGDYLPQKDALIERISDVVNMLHNAKHTYDTDSNIKDDRIIIAGDFNEFYIRPWYDRRFKTYYDRRIQKNSISSGMLNDIPSTFDIKRNGQRIRRMFLRQGEKHDDRKRGFITPYDTINSNRPDKPFDLVYDSEENNAHLYDRKRVITAKPVWGRHGHVTRFSDHLPVIYDIYDSQRQSLRQHRNNSQQHWGQHRNNSQQHRGQPRHDPQRQWGQPRHDPQQPLRYQDLSRLYEQQGKHQNTRENKELQQAIQKKLKLTGREGKNKVIFTRYFDDGLIFPTTNKTYNIHNIEKTVHNIETILEDGQTNWNHCLNGRSGNGVSLYSYLTSLNITEYWDPNNKINKYDFLNNIGFYDGKVTLYLKDPLHVVSEKVQNSFQELFIDDINNLNISGGDTAKMLKPVLTFFGAVILMILILVIIDCITYSLDIYNPLRHLLLFPYNWLSEYMRINNM